jgi:hypothetical protein
MQRAAAAMTKSTNRIFDFSKHGKCKIALRVAYAGWDMHGFAWQKDSSNTVEQALFEALEKTRCVRPASLPGAPTSALPHPATG